MNIKAIETIYNGYKFRSRLEARWATFFNALGIEYWYEKEGFSLGGVPYLPDFYLPRLSYWIEVKPDVPMDDEREKAIRLCIDSAMTTIILAGDAWTTVKCFNFCSTIQTREEITAKYEKYEDSTVSWITTTECIINDRDTHRLMGYNLVSGYVWSESVWYECGKCGHVSILGIGLSCCACDPPDFQMDTPRLQEAFTKARQARFERGGA